VSNTQRALGAAGEDFAAAYLEAQGYRILDRNVRSAGVEMDIVARRGRTLVFVEVKTRRTRQHGPAVLAVDARKRGRLIRGAQGWLAEHRGRRAEVRFDVVGVERDDAGAWVAHHVEGAFDASEGR
jgi:putative endonuclease